MVTGVALQPVSVDRFGGLDLRDDPSEVGLSTATDLLNVDFDAGRVRTRYGFIQANALAGNGGYYAIVPTGTPYRFLVVYPGTVTAEVDRFSAGTGSIGTFTAVGSLTAASRPSLTGWARLGTLTAGYVYLSSVTLSGVYAALCKYDGTTVTASTGSPKFVATTPWDNRLVQARYAGATTTPSGANGSGSTVFFSDPSAPETYTATNWVRLQPGDGEAITGIAAWGNQLFVFKRTNLFVFYGTSTDQTGGAVFNYRVVGLGCRVADINYGLAPVTAGEEGVYFVADDGVYVTSGGTPRRISEAITPIFDGTAGATLAVDPIRELSLAWAANRLFMGYQTQSAVRTLVFDPRTTVWSVWSNVGGSNVGGVASGAVSSGSVSGAESLYHVNGDANVYRQEVGQADDDGTAIASHYQSGFQAVADGASARFRRFELTGTGTVAHATASEYGAVGTSASVVMGTAPTVGRGFDTRAARARDLSYKVSATSGLWGLNRWRTWIADVRQR